MPRLAPAAFVLLTLWSASAMAGDRGPHPVFAWNGNEFLFEVKPRGSVTYLTGYRAIGDKWQQVGSTTIRKGQRAPKSGFLQDIWFRGKRIGSLAADMSNPYWRRYPADDRNGGGNGIFF